MPLPDDTEKIFRRLQEQTVKPVTLLWKEAKEANKMPSPADSLSALLSTLPPGSKVTIEVPK